MEEYLKALFDLQKYSKNKKLENIIKETEQKYAINLTELGDDELSCINAAGDVYDIHRRRQDENI